MDAILDIERVSKSFAQTQVLNDVSLKLGRGETVGLVGLNGAGKTTLLRGVLDLSRIDSGSITIDGLPHTVTRSRECVSFLGERFSPPEFATGYELLAHLLALHGKTLDTLSVAREASALALDLDALQRPARDYSKGMAQKLGLIACLLTRCPLLILDEPMSGLDPRARVLFKQRLSALKADGVSILFSTHLLFDVEQLCDRLVLLHAGRVVWQGPPASLLQQSGAANLEAAFLATVEHAA